tara:strand:- start:783 stop:1166 length:384 start_codon:yes stop_codon:yes gene_type:complete
MKTQQIKDAVLCGLTVNWKNENYIVKHSRKVGFYIEGNKGNNMIALTHTDMQTLNGKEDDFYATVKGKNVVKKELNIYHVWGTQENEHISLLFASKTPNEVAKKYPENTLYISLAKIDNKITYKIIF